jgi:hypothetical protein
MKKRIAQAGVLFVVVVAAAQLVRPDRTNPPIDTRLTIHAHATPELAAVLDRSCGDCHSNQTEWPSYARIAPVSWVMARAVREGRKAVNFSEWGSYSPAQQEALLAVSCDDAMTGRMPGVYARIRPQTKLSPDDIKTICAAGAHQAEPRNAAVSQ